ncbi:hypothetical protein [Gymnodinialimonas hymeniacidonis]|uniref:hypothetical protein n=1 Tax=Gymnodinialimonas hymeniacidonis TaxID=3126508 RepID=UPI0034C5CF13
MRFLLCGLFALMPSLATAQTEQLLAPIPPGYTLVFSTQSEDGSATMQEWVPDGESTGNWSQMLTVQIFHGLTDVPPGVFHGRLRTLFQEQCASGEHLPITDGVELGTPFDLMLATCPDAPNANGRETFVSKAMAGQDALYLVQGAWRGELSEALMTEWTQYLATVTVCDSRRVEAPCPQ